MSVRAASGLLLICLCASISISVVGAELAPRATVVGAELAPPSKLAPPIQGKKGGNPEAAKLKNPVATTPDSIAAGRRVYQRMCARCHGPAGKGDGSTAGNTPPSDLTDATWDYGSTDGEIYTAIHDGVSIDMDGYAQRVPDTDIWNTVNYLRSLASTK